MAGSRPSRPLDGLNGTELDACAALLERIGPDIGVDLGQVFARLRDGRSLTEAMDLPAQTADLLYAQAIGRFNAGDNHGALSLFQGLVVLAPEVRDHWLGLGICARLMGFVPIARVAFETAVQLSPRTPAPRFHLCEALCQIQDWTAAAEHLRAFDACAETPEKRTLSAEMKRLSAAIGLRRG